MSITLKLDKVCVVFASDTGGEGVRALDNISIAVEPEEYIVVLGASGYRQGRLQSDLRADGAGRQMLNFVV